MTNEEQPRQKPFISWVEMLVILSIIGLLAALLVPARQGSGSSSRMHCLNNKTQLYLALQSYHNVYQSFPPAYTVDTDGEPLHSWRVLVLPYLESTDLFRQIRLDEPWDSEHNRQFHDQMPTIFACPVISMKKGETTYQVLTGAGTYFPGTQCRSLNDTTLDKKSTVLLVENVTPCCWMAPVDFSRNALEESTSGTSQIRSHHARHPNVIMADGTQKDCRLLYNNR